MGMPIASLQVAMRVLERDEVSETRVEETRLVWFFAAALAFFIFALLGVGTLLRFLW